MKTTIKNNVISRYSYLNNKLGVVGNDKNNYRVIATDKIVKDEIIAVWGGRVVHRDDLPEHINHSPMYLQISDELFMVSPELNEHPDAIHFIQQSFEPNSGFRGEITLVAMRDIYPEEEITYDPRMNSKKGYLIRSVREKYNKYFSDFIQRKIEQESTNKFMEGAWGLLTSLDIESCDPNKIRNADEIKRYVYELCDLIEMKRFGDCHVVHFGEDERVAGYSMFQLIETSCISAHFANETNTSYIDVFSCKAYDPKVVSDFSREFFKGNKTRMTVTNRY